MKPFLTDEAYENITDKIKNVYDTIHPPNLVWLLKLFIKNFRRLILFIRKLLTEHLMILEILQILILKDLNEKKSVWTNE